MSTPSACAHAHEDAAYVLGALSPDDRGAFERHLPGCAACAQSVRELAGIPGLLARVPLDLVDPPREPPPVPATLLPALVRQVRRTERRRSWSVAALVGAAAAVAVIAVGVAALGNDDPPSAAPAPTPSTSSPTAEPTSPPEALRPVGDEPISGWVSLTPVGWGTRLDLTCSYAAESSDYPEPDWSTHRMLVRTDDGAVEQVATWRALPGKTMELTAATALASTDIVSIEVRTAADEVVLELDR